jgi:cation diffusion facilitator family transporter
MISHGIALPLSIILRMSSARKTDLTRYAWLSIAAAAATILLKLLAFWLTNSVGLLSDALESVANLATAVVALVALSIASRPADEEFTYGYSKVEFFSSGFEGAVILVAAGGIIFTAIPRLIHPEPLEQIGVGIAISAAASLINLVVSLTLTRAARRYHSITLEADANHLMTDVFTTAGVLIGIFLVALTGWDRLDPIVALLVAANILFTGLKLVRKAGLGLMDAALPPADIVQIQDVLAQYDQQEVQFHALRTRSAARRSFVSMHILVPGEWSVQRAHYLAEEVEMNIRERLPNINVFTHVEPLEDPASWQDTRLE